MPHFLNMKTTTGTNRRERSARIPHQGKIIRHRAAVLLAATLSAVAGEHAALSATATKPELSDLTFSNAFSTGWDEPWTKRSRGDGTPDMPLLRVQTNFLGQRVFRTDYAHQENLSSASIRATDSLTGTLEYALNRRLMLAVFGNYGWLDSRRLSDFEGATGRAFVRLQWVDTAASSIATTLKVMAPNRDLGEKDSTLSLAISGWRDLARMGLKHTGLYWHVQEETLVGPVTTGGRRNDFTYAVSLAKTWSSPDSLFGNATTFVEAYGKTDLDGNDSGHIVMAGLIFPSRTHGLSSGSSDSPTSATSDPAMRATSIRGFVIRGEPNTPENVSFHHQTTTTTELWTSTTSTN